MGIISEEKKFIFIHIPKTGGTSVSNALSDYGRPFNRIEGFHRFMLTQHPQWTIKIRNIEHMTGPLLLSFLGAEIWSSYHKFSIVRNPWARIVSWYFYVKSHKSERKYKIANVLSFEEFVEYVTQTGLTTQYEYLYDDQGHPVVDTILKTENLNFEGTQLISKLAQKTIEMPFKKQTNHSHYSEIHTDKSRDIVSRYFKNEIQKFEYEY